MPKEFSNLNLQKMAFKNEDLRSALFQGTDLRGADFSGSDLSGASFVNVRTGITPNIMLLIFLVALLVSALAGYVAMLAGATLQTMLVSDDWKIRMSGLATITLILFFMSYTYWKGSQNAVIRLIVPVFFFSIVVGAVNYFSGVGTGKGMLYELVVLLVLVAMLVVGTIARAITGILANIIFLIVALMGSIFGNSVGSGIGTVMMALSSALISKKALSSTKGFETTIKIAAFFIAKFGTSFRNCNMTRVDFSQSKTIKNADFSNADTFLIHWGNCKKANCIV